MFRKISQVMLLVLLLCAVQPIFANDTFTIEDYVPEKFTDLMWQIDGTTYGSANTSKNGSDDQYITDYFEKRNSSSYSFSLNSKMLYENETLEKYLRTSLQVSTSFRSSSHDNYRKSEQGIPLNRIDIDKDVNSNKIAQFRFSPQMTYKDYFKNNLFYSVSLSGSFDYDYSLKYRTEQEDLDFHLNADTHYYHISNTVRDKDRDSRYYNTVFQFMVGDGRQYVGRYAFTASNIIEELRKEGLLLKQPDKNIMIALTDIIYQFENKHTIDARLKQIDKYDSIYSFLLKNNIVVENNHLGMLLVQDAFEMFPRESRRFGFSKSIGVGFKFRYQSIHESSIDDIYRLSYHFQTDTPYLVDTLSEFDVTLDRYYKRSNESLWKYAVASLSYGKPINMKWQVDASASARYYFDSYEKRSYSSTYQIEKKYDIGATVGTDYYYSSRTIWRSSMSYNYSRYKQDSDDIYSPNDRDEKNWSFRMRSSLEYRLNIPTTIRGSIEYSNSDGDSIYNDTLKYSDYTNFNFSISLLHYIY